MLYDVIEDLKKYDITDLEWLCKEPHRVIKSQRNVKMYDWHLTDDVTDFVTDYVTDTWKVNKVNNKIWELQHQVPPSQWQWVLEYMYINPV